MWHKTDCWVKQMHTHKINHKNLSSLQMDIFNWIQTERWRAVFIQKKEQLYYFLQALMGRSYYQIFMVASCLHKSGWWSNSVDSPCTKTQPFSLSPSSKSVAVSDRSWWEMIALLSCLMNCNSFVLKTQTDSLCISPFQQNWV